MAASKPLQLEPRMHQSKAMLADWRADNALSFGHQDALSLIVYVETSFFHQCQLYSMRLAVLKAPLLRFGRQHDWMSFTAQHTAVPWPQFPSGGHAGYVLPRALY
jgi:hypothetical protein